MIEILKRLDFKKLPGLEAQTKMAPPLRMKELYNTNDYKELRPSSILITLFLKNEKWHTLVIKRASDGSIHSGQIAFPGGKYEKTDKDFSYTALRETEEEIGIKAYNVHIIGKLSTMYIPVSGFKVYPFIGYLKKLPQLRPNKSEVTQIFSIPLDEFRKKENLKTDYIDVRGCKIKTPYYFIQKQIIWGATAMIISELIEFLPV